MSMRSANGKRTLCEVLREINDVLQGDPLHPVILPKLVEAERMSKRMAQKLYENNKQFDAGWWKDNTDYEADLKRRMAKNYITE